MHFILGNFHIFENTEEKVYALGNHSHGICDETENERENWKLVQIEFTPSRKSRKLFTGDRVTREAFEVNQHAKASF